MGIKQRLENLETKSGSGFHVVICSEGQSTQDAERHYRDIHDLTDDVLVTVIDHSMAKVL